MVVLLKNINALFIVLIGFFGNSVFAQCPTSTTSAVMHITCNGDDDGQYIVEVLDGTSPFTFQLWKYEAPFFFTDSQCSNY